MATQMRDAAPAARRAASSTGTKAGGAKYPCVARQPILDRYSRVVAYELLFRRSSDVQTCDVSRDNASAQVIVDGVMSIGLDNLVRGKRAFVNVTREVLVSGAASLLPRDQVVIELLEDIQPDPEVIAACTALKRAGYPIALDDFAVTAESSPLLALADYVKVDFLALDTPEARHATIAAVRDAGVRLLAEKIETTEQFEAATAEGFMFFQGYFFARPSVREMKRAPAARIGYVSLLHKLSDPEITVFDLEEVIKHDASLTYRVLRAVNSAATALRVEIRSIRHAIVLLGRDTIRRWASLWALAAMSDPSRDELVASSVMRARCCELLDASSRNNAGTGFLLGMCSLLDVILDQPMETVLAQLPVDAEVRAALLGEANARRTLLDCVIAYERADWDLSEQLAREAGLDTRVLPGAYEEALRWTRLLTVKTA